MQVCHVVFFLNNVTLLYSKSLDCFTCLIFFCAALKLCTLFINDHIQKYCS